MLTSFHERFNHLLETLATKYVITEIDAEITHLTKFSKMTAMEYSEALGTRNLAGITFTLSTPEGNLLWGAHWMNLTQHRLTLGIEVKC